jgi:DMSO/TMAO reductase YedYZ heme-binding membrane subunit
MPAFAKRHDSGAAFIEIAFRYLERRSNPTRPNQTAALVRNGNPVVKRKFIFLGFSTFVLLIPLAATSTNSALRRLGYVRWKQLHRLAYLAPALAVLHFTLRVKRDESEPLAYGLVLAALLTVRLIEYMGAHGALLTGET